MADSDKLKPTVFSELNFSYAANKAFPGIKNGLSPQEIADILHKMASGLEGMAIGLRATYNLLAEVKQIASKNP
jgi:hypothetical protein